MHPASQKKLSALGVESHDLATMDGLFKQVIEDGWTFTDFKKALAPLFQRKRWWDALVEHKSEEESELELAYGDTIRAFRSSNDWQRIQRLSSRAPFLRFVAIQDGNTCAMCKTLHGKIFHVGNTIWPTLFPPNHSGCRCSIMQLSKRDIEEFEYKLDMSEACAAVVINPATNLPFAPAEGYGLHPLEANTINAETILKVGI